jgi:hypothetical protein
VRSSGGAAAARATLTDVRADLAAQLACVATQGAELLALGLRDLPIGEDTVHGLARACLERTEARDHVLPDAPPRREPIDPLPRVSHAPLDALPQIRPRRIGESRNRNETNSQNEQHVLHVHLLK